MAQDSKSDGVHEMMKDEDVKRSPLYIELSENFAFAETRLKNLQKELESVKNRWAVTKGDLQVANKTMKDLEEKYEIRLKELSGESDDTANTSQASHKEQAKLIMELEHKLKHALDNVMQSETIRSSLSDAHSMNDVLQRQVSELKRTNEELKTGNPNLPLDSNEKVQKMKREFDQLKYKMEVSTENKYATRKMFRN